MEYQQTNHVNFSALLGRFLETLRIQCYSQLLSESAREELIVKIADFYNEALDIIAESIQRNKEHRGRGKRAPASFGNA